MYIVLSFLHFVWCCLLPSLHSHSNRVFKLIALTSQSERPCWGIVSILVLFLWPAPGSIFVDRICIHQEDPDLKGTLDHLGSLDIAWFSSSRFEFYMILHDTLPEYPECLSRNSIYILQVARLSLTGKSGEIDAAIYSVQTCIDYI